MAGCEASAGSHLGKLGLTTSSSAYGAWIEREQVARVRATARLSPTKEIRVAHPPVADSSPVLPQPAGYAPKYCHSTMAYSPGKGPHAEAPLPQPQTSSTAGYGGVFAASARATVPHMGPTQATITSRRFKSFYGDKHSGKGAEGPLATHPGLNTVYNSVAKTGAASGEGFGLGGADGSVHRALSPQIILNDKNTATGLVQTPRGLMTYRDASALPTGPDAAPAAPASVPASSKGAWSHTINYPGYVSHR